MLVYGKFEPGTTKISATAAHRFRMMPQAPMAVTLEPPAARAPTHRGSFRAQ